MRQKLTMESCSMRIDGSTRDNTSLSNQKSMGRKGVLEGRGERC